MHQGKTLHIILNCLFNQNLVFIQIPLLIQYFLLWEFPVILGIDGIAVKYGLLPNDALIASTCKHYGVNIIATFDEDFKRIPWLRVIL